MNWKSEAQDVLKRLTHQTQGCVWKTCNKSVISELPSGEVAISFRYSAHEKWQPCVVEHPESLVACLPPAVSPHTMSRPVCGTIDSCHGGYVGQGLSPCADNCLAAAGPKWSLRCKTGCSRLYVLRKDAFSSVLEVS